MSKIELHEIIKVKTQCAHQLKSMAEECITAELRSKLQQMAKTNQVGLTHRDIITDFVEEVKQLLRESITNKGN